MKAYKLVRKLKSGLLALLFINKKLRYIPGIWCKAESYPTKGFALRPGFHCCSKPEAPHLSLKGRVWVEVSIEDYEEIQRPESQGGLWYLAQKMKVMKEVPS